MPLKYNLKDKSAPLGELEIHQIDMLRFHMGADRDTGIQVACTCLQSLHSQKHFQEPRSRDEVDCGSSGLRILKKLLTGGNYVDIVRQVLGYLDGTDLTALQLGHHILDSFIKVGFHI